jgi:predicted hydrolase (HD superfamily)
VTDYNREEALRLLHAYVKSERVLDHVYATERVMRALARRLGNDEELWGIAGLIHDLDVELAGFDFSIHGHRTKQILTDAGLDPDFVESVVMHNEAAFDWKERTTEFQWALAAGDRMTWLIYATKRAQPDKPLSSVTPELLLQRFNEEGFARSLERPTILECLRLGIPLEEFVRLCLDAMKSSTAGSTEYGGSEA